MAKTNRNKPETKSNSEAKRKSKTPSKGETDLNIIDEKIRRYEKDQEPCVIEMWQAHDMAILQAKDFPALVAVLEGIIPYWKVLKGDQHADLAQFFSRTIYERSELLREAYIKKHDIELRPCPLNFREMKAWRFDAECAIRKETLKDLPPDIPREPITLKIFIEKALGIDRAKNENLRRQLSKYKSLREIDYPPEVGTAQKGQSKRYKPEDLVTYYKKWRVNKPDLPPFKTLPK